MVELEESVGPDELGGGWLSDGLGGVFEGAVVLFPGVLALLDELPVELPTSARLIGAGELVEGVVADELDVDELVRGGVDGFDEELRGELGRDVGGVDGEVGGYVLEGETEGSEVGAEAGVEGLVVDGGVVVEGELLEGGLVGELPCVLVGELPCVDEVLCCEEVEAPLLDVPVELPPELPVDVCAWAAMPPSISAMASAMELKLNLVMGLPSLEAIFVWIEVLCQTQQAFPAQGDLIPWRSDDKPEGRSR